MFLECIVVLYKVGSLVVLLQSDIQSQLKPTSPWQNIPITYMYMYIDGDIKVRHDNN